MRRGRFAVASLAGLSSLVVLAGLSWFTAKPAIAELRVYSGDLASCAGGGISVDLVATGTIEDVASPRTSSRVEVRVERVSLGDRDYYARETLFVETDSGTYGGNVGDVSFGEGDRYELYLQREGDKWKTNTCLGTHESTDPSQNAPSAPGTGASTGSTPIPETGGPDVLTLAALGGFFLAGIGAALARRGRRIG